MALRLLVLLLLLTAVSSRARSEILGTDLYGYCIQSIENSRERDGCSAFILGVLKGIDYGAMGRSLSKRPCFGQYVPPTQAELIVKKYMNDHPDMLGYDAGMIATVAILTAFHGCQPAE
jgi:hypothetical protein